MINKIQTMFAKINGNVVVIVFFMIQPIMDMYLAFFKEPIQIAGVSINILINFLLIGFLFIYTIVTYKKKKEFLYYLPYLAICAIYAVLHYYNMTRFQEGIINRETYGFIKETYYMVRIYFLPILLLFLLYKMDIKRETLLRVVKYSVLAICAIIVLTNILGVSLVSYSDELENEFIQGNIFKWFTFKGGEDFDAYTSKGFFVSANQVSAILLMLSPIVIKEAMKKRNLKNYGLVILLVITMVMLGTKTSGFGILLAIVAVMCMMLFFKILKLYKEKIAKPMLGMIIITLIGVILLVNSPMFNKTYGKFKIFPEERPTEEKIETIIEEEDDLSLVEYIKQHSWNFFIQSQLLDIYPVENDLPFWIDKATRDVRLNSDFRVIKTEIFERVIERNNNFMDKIVGIGYSDGLYNEKDYLYQYFQFGALGVLLFIGPYILVLLYAISKILLKPKTYFTIDNCTYAMALTIGLILPYVTGHVFGVTFVMSYMTLLSALLLKNIKQTKDEPLVEEA